MAKISEETSSKIGSLAGQILNGSSLKEAEDWLEREAISGSSEAQRHALVLLGTLQSVRKIAASALTQRPNRT